MFLFLEVEIMKRSLIVVGLLVLATCLQSCIVVVDEEARHPREPKRPFSVDGTITEIDAAGKLALNSHKRDAYEGIAGRVPLSPEAQVHLVMAVFDNLALESAKERVLLTLIDNPSFCPDGERAILESLDKLADSDEPLRHRV